VTVIIVSKSEH